MNPNRFFMPGMQFSNPMYFNNYMMARNGGLFSRIYSGIKNFNWNGLLSGANKTLNVVNQTIPLVRQAGPMFNNMKNMFHLAKAFKNETYNNTSVSKINNKSNNMHTVDKEIKKEVMDHNYPNFFL